jgi:hypothetical protein
MDTKLSWFVGVLAVVNVAVVLEFVRRRKLAESFAVLWIVVGAGGVLFALLRHQIDTLSRKVGIYAGTSLVFTLGILFLLFVCMGLSMHVSRLTDRTEILAEEVAILRARLEQNPGEAPSHDLRPIEQ